MAIKLILKRVKPTKFQKQIDEIKTLSARLAVEELFKSLDALATEKDFGVAKIHCVMGYELRELKKRYKIGIYENQNNVSK